MNRTPPRIVLLARIVRWAATAAIALGAASWLWTCAAWYNGALPPGDPASPLSAHHAGLAWTIGSLGLAATGWGLVRIVQLMRIYESGVVFDARTAFLIGSFAAAICLRALIDIGLPPLFAVALRLSDGRTPVSFVVGASQIHVLFIALVFLLIAKIMAVGHRLADDNAKIV